MNGDIVIHNKVTNYTVRGWKRAKDKLDKNEFKDRLFDVLNDTDDLPIQDIKLDDRNDLINVYLKDGTRFLVRIENCGK